MNKKFERYLFHVNNKEQIELMCKRFLYSYSIEVSTEDNPWCYLTAELNVALAN